MVTTTTSSATAATAAITTTGNQISLTEKCQKRCGKYDEPYPSPLLTLPYLRPQMIALTSV